jgi:hypothetical protein
MIFNWYDWQIDQLHDFAKDYDAVRVICQVDYGYWYTVYTMSFAGNIYTIIM